MPEIKKRRNYDKEFKITAVKLMLDSENTTDQIARDLGVSSNTLYLWRKKYLEDAQNAFPGKGHMKPEQEEMKKKDKLIARLKMENEILKKAMGFFASYEE